MFQRLGNLVSRFWPIVLVGWILLAVVLAAPKFLLDLGLPKIAPEWEDVITQGEFAFLPPESVSLQGERLANKAFPDDILRSAVVVIVRREAGSEGLLEADYAFIEEELEPRLRELVVEHAVVDPGQVVDNAGEEERGGDEESDDEEPPNRVRTFNDEKIGRLLTSEDKRASLVIIELDTEFLDKRNGTLIEAIEKLIGNDSAIPKIKGAIFKLKDDQGDPVIPPGLSIAISGSATVGRDMLKAQRESSDATELWTVIMVVFLLVVIYRAPLLAIIPLITVYVSALISLKTLAILAEHGFVDLFAGIKVYVTVLTYGAGVDYCLFLIARYREELDDGNSIDEGVANSLGKVGHAVTASAGTVICGIGMLIFAQFGKFQQAGVGIAFGLVVVLLASLTFTPALLRLFGRWAFWPRITSERASAGAGWLSPTSLITRVFEANLFQRFWTHMGTLLETRPVMIWAASLALMLPFALIGTIYYGYLSYGLSTELPDNSPSVAGARAVQSHFPAGMGGEATLLLKNDKLDFILDPGLVDETTNLLLARKEALQIADVRSKSKPLGDKIELSSREQRGAALYYVSRAEGLERAVTRIDVVFDDDPFSRGSISQLEYVERTVRSSLLGQLLGIVIDADQGNRIESVIDFSVAEEAELLAGDVITSINSRRVLGEDDIQKALDEAPADKPLKLTVESAASDKSREVELTPIEDWKAIHNTELLVVGPTASIRDLKRVTDSDQLRIDVLVLAGVYLILVILLRKPAICLYLIISVFFSYFVTIGVTFAVFWSLDPSGFAGLDWKVPMFLFTILIAVGEDYNIFLMTRIEEEQELHGQTGGVIVALKKTGSIISSCGFIMAGTFSSLLAGSLEGMQQLGFALAFGVLLDTFVIRPILVPAYLVMLYEGRFGWFGRFLGAGVPTSETNEETD